MIFVHTSDWQLGKPFASIENPEKRGQVKEARFRAVERIGDVVKEHGAAFVVVAGDLFDSTTPDKAIVSKACQAIGKLKVPVLVIPGNHDYGGPGSVWEQEFFMKEKRDLAPNLWVLLKPESVELDEAVILPCPLLFKTTVEDPARWLRSFDYSSLPPHKTRLVLAHGSVYDFSGHEGEFATNLLALNTLPLDDIDYIALGDWHGTIQIEPKVWYSGTPEPDRFPKDGGYDPGNVLVVEARRGADPKVTEVSTAELRWLVLSFSFAGEDSFDELEILLTQNLGGSESRSLLRFAVEGPVGIESARRLRETEERWRARLLELVWEDNTKAAPTQEEVESLIDGSEDPLIASVAHALLEMSQGKGEDAEVAKVAFQELYLACEEVAR